MAVRQSGFTRASALGPIADFVEGLGGSIERILQDVDLPYTLLQNPDMPLPLKEQFRLLRRAARETGDEHFGARLGHEVRIKNLSAFGKWVCAAETLDQAIHRGERGLNVFLQTATTLKLETQGQTTRWSIEFLDPESDGRYQNELLGLGYLIDTVRQYAGATWTPNYVATTTTGKNQTSALEQLYGTNVSVGHAVSTIEFPAELLQAKSHHRQLTLSEESPFPEYLGRELPVPGGIHDYEAFVALTHMALLEGYPRIDWIAEKVGLTRRSLQRRLETHGTTFAAVLDDVLRARATELVADTSKPITEIALALGYADSSHFTRAFKRWTGLAPKSYRQMLN